MTNKHRFFPDTLTHRMIFQVSSCIYFILFLTTSLAAIDQSETARFFNDLIQAYEIPGLSVAIVEGNKVTYSGAHGVKATDSKEPVDEETIFSAASLSKPCFAYGVMKLVQAGKLDLDKPLYLYLEYEDIAHDERYRKITARMILSHSSGLPNWRNGKLELKFEPGEKYQYSGEGFVYLGKVIEQIMEVPLNDFMDDYVFRPLAMTNSSYVWKAAFESNYAAPHGFLRDAQSKYRPGNVNVAASLQTTAEDYAKLLIAMLNSTGLKPATVAEMFSPQIDVDDSGRLFWGLGWGLQQTEKGKAIWQWGDNGVFKAYTIAYPELGRGLVFLANSYNGLKIVPEVIDFVFQDKSPAFDMLDYETAYTPDQKLLKGILAFGYDKAVQDFLSPDGAHQDTSQIDEGQMNYVGTQLTGRKRFEDAGKVFLANIAAFPDLLRLMRIMPTSVWAGEILMRQENTI